MPINRGIDKEVMVHIYNGILLSHKKEWNWVICRDVDGSRYCHTEWSKSEREKQISYINAYMWNLEKWSRWTGLQGRNRDTDVENKHMDTKGDKKRWLRKLLQRLSTRVTGIKWKWRTGEVSEVKWRKAWWCMERGVKREESGIPHTWNEDN